MLKRHAGLGIVSLVLISSLVIAKVATAAQVYGFTTVTTSSAGGGLGLSLPSINGSGTVAFVNTSPGTNGLYTGNGGPLSTVLTSATDFQLYFAGGPGAPSTFSAPAQLMASATPGGLARSRPRS